MAKRFLVIVVFIFVSASAWAQAPIEYKLSFPSPEHRWMQVEVRFSGRARRNPCRCGWRARRPAATRFTSSPRTSSTSSIVNGKGQPLTATRPDPHQWDIAGHDGTVVVTYKIFGDRTDGTYLGIDDMHAHINIPAALMFARGWFERPARVTFVQPPGKTWKVATQLFPTADPLVFTAPNIHYLMDSPTDFSDFMLRTFTVDDGQKRPGRRRRSASR